MALLAAIGWLISLYLISPLTALFAWWFGYQRLNIFIFSDPQHTMKTLILYSMIIAAGGITFILWAIYNWLRFRGLHRRGVPDPTTEEDMATAFHISPQSIRTARNGKVVAFNFDDHGQITGIETPSSLNDAPEKTLSENPSRDYSALAPAGW